MKETGDRKGAVCMQSAVFRRQHCLTVDYRAVALFLDTRELRRWCGLLVFFPGFEGKRPGHGFLSVVFNANRARRAAYV